MTLEQKADDVQLRIVLLRRDATPFLGSAYERSMINREKHSVTVIVTDEHFRKMVDGHLLKEDEIGDDSKVARAVQKLLNSSLGLPEDPSHDWDDWGKGLQ